MKTTLPRLATNALVAALYVVLTLVTSSFAYRDIQFRVAEILVLLAFFRKDYVLGVTVGCFIANLFSPLGFPDIIFGTLATLISSLLIASSRNIFVASLYPVLINGLVVGLELYFIEGLPILLSFLFVAIGEFVVVSIAGVAFFKFLQSRTELMTIIDANQNLPKRTS